MNSSFLNYNSDPIKPTLQNVFLKLKRASHQNKDLGKAPHKPILLLSIIELMDEGIIAENKIFVSPELVATFQNLWLKLVPSEGWQPRFFLPFYHLSSDGFWHLKLASGAKVALTNSYSPKSLGALKDSIYFGYFDDSIFSNLINPDQRDLIKTQILDYYFPHSDFEKKQISLERKQYLEQLELNFLSGQAAETPVKWMKIIQSEVRSVLFKTEVPKKYKYTCAISGQRINANMDYQFIDACHIRPWSKSKDDSIQNGITLSPTLHRAFDRFIISLDEDYRVILSDAFTENENSPHNLRQFKGKKILLPENKAWYPSQESLAWHRSNLLT